MSFTRPYTKYPDSQSGGFYYAATLPVNIALPAKNPPRSKRFDAIIDSGASACLFHASIGRAIGREIEKGETNETLGINGPNKVYMHDVSLYAPGGVIGIRAGFSDELPIAGLLGMTGFFDHFTITFDPTGNRFILDRLYQA